MYHVLLTNRYLTSRVIPLIAVAAVALCVALVIIVVSVMTGFLDMVKNSGRSLIGDVVISYPVSGIGYYDRLIARLENVPEVEAATPVVEGWGLLRMPYPDGPRKETETVQIWAVEPASFARVTAFADSLYWRPPHENEIFPALDFRRELLENENVGETGLEHVYQEGLRLEHVDENGNAIPGIDTGIHVSIANERQKDGSYRPMRDGYWWMRGREVVLTALPSESSSAELNPENARLIVVNEFVSGVFLIDDKRIIIPLEVGQKLLHLDESEIVDDEGETIGIDPPRATMILVRAAEGVSPDQLKERVNEAYDAFHRDLRNDESVAYEAVPPPRGRPGVIVQTWLEQQQQFIAPIEKERELMRTLFSMIYLVCAGLVLSIFWAIVYEKTRDIGILRSLGASRLGISYIFLRYGFFVGVLGAVVGLGLAYLVIRNINSIHSAMGDPPVWLAAASFALAAVFLVVMLLRSRTGRLLPIVLGSLLVLVFGGIGVGVLVVKFVLHGVVIWDPSVYYFSVIPNDVDPIAAVTTMIGAVVFSVLGAFFPAAKAADTDPVKALRYE